MRFRSQKTLKSEIVGPEATLVLCGPLANESSFLVVDTRLVCSFFVEQMTEAREFVAVHCRRNLLTLEF